MASAVAPTIMMSTWYRVFGTNSTEPAPAALLEYVQAVEPGTTAAFKGDSEGWFQAEVVCRDATVVLERFLASEEGIRAELNNWAAWIETVEGHPQRDRLMRHMIGTSQLFTLRSPLGEAGMKALCLAACRFLAAATEGVFQVDDEGFFAADGTSLIKE
jgi:hypothetical protein